MKSAVDFKVAHQSMSETFVDRQTSDSHFKGKINLSGVHSELITRTLILKQILPKNISIFSALRLVHEHMTTCDYSLESHSYRTYAAAAEMYTLLSQSYSLSFPLADFKVGALLHDIGKAAIRPSILCKKEALSSEEVNIIKTHTTISYFILFDFIGINQTILNMALYHHEKFDGSGYPHGLKGTEIPFESRLFALLDVFDALTSDRPYRRGMSSTQALDLMNSSKFNGHFDPELLDLFNQHMANNHVLS